VFLGGLDCLDVKEVTVAAQVADPSLGMAFGRTACNPSAMIEAFRPVSYSESKSGYRTVRPTSAPARLLASCDFCLCHKLIH
jgi:hypothetical protein